MYTSFSLLNGTTYIKKANSRGYLAFERCNGPVPKGIPLACFGS